MEPLTEHLSDQLFWVQPKAMRRSYELRTSDALLGSLVFETPFGSRATAQANGKVWSFKRMGFFKPRVTVRAADGSDDIAVYHPKWSGSEGELTLSHGRSYTWTIANFWATRYDIRDAQGEALISFSSGTMETAITDVLKNQSEVTITDAGQGVAEIDLLVLIGWYLIVLQREDSAAITATVATSV
jgi:hypothetical protein